MECVDSDKVSMTFEVLIAVLLLFSVCGDVTLYSVGMSHCILTLLETGGDGKVILRNISNEGP